ncbi:hypothetical protein DNTS_032754, partial [Danionella cerebrum]
VLIRFHAEAGDLLINLGSNVTIKCDLEENEIFWILQKSEDPPTPILRSFLTPPDSLYFNKTFRRKYSVALNHSLVITNISEDELGVYYCMTTGVPPKFSSSTRIYINKSSYEPECHNQTQLELIKQKKIQTQIISIIIFALLSGLLLILII